MAGGQHLLNSSKGRRLVVRCSKFTLLIKAGLRNVSEKRRLKMEVLPPVASVKSLHESTKRTKIVTVTVIVIANANAIHIVIEAKTTIKSREARSTITAVVMMPSMKRGMDIVPHIGITKSEKKIILLGGRRRIGSIAGPRSIMRGMMGGNAKERGIESERERSGMMYHEERVGTEAFQSEEKTGFMMRGQRRCH
jgi:hypothetical protein